MYKPSPDDDFEGSSSFSKLEKEFQTILSDLSSDENLERFKVDYEQLYNALVQSNSNEKHVRQKINSLHQELLRNATRVHKAIELSKVDQETIKELKNEIEKSWKMVEIAQEKEEISKRTIESLSSEISKLSHMMSVDAEYGRTASITVEEIHQAKCDLEHEHEEILEAEESCSHDVQKINSSLKSIQIEKSKIVYQIKKVDKENDFRNIEYAKQIEERESVESEIQFRTESIEILGRDISQFAEDIETVKKKEEEVIKKRRLKCSETMDLKKKYDKEVEKKDSFDREIKFLVRQRSSLEANNEELNGNYFNLVNFISEKHKKKTQIKHEILNLEKKMNYYNDEIPKLEYTGTMLKKKMDLLSGKEIKSYKTKINLLKKETDRRQYHKSLLEGNMSKVLKSDHDIRRYNVIVNNSKLNIEKIFQKTRIDGEKFRRMIFEIEKEIGNLILHESETRIQVSREIEISRNISEKNGMLQNSVNENSRKMKHQVEMFERIRKERNFYNKMYLQTQEHIEKMRQKFKMLYKQIKQLKLEIHQTEKSQFENSKILEVLRTKKVCVKENRDILGKEIILKKKELISVKEEIKKWNEELCYKLKEIEIQEKDVNSIFKDRDILGTKIINRDKEIDNLYEKIKIQQQFLILGKKKYRKRIKNILLMNSKLKILQQKNIQISLFSKFLDSVDSRIQSFHKQLYIERTRMNLLKQEYSNKINVHRWRYLEDVDPQKYQMIFRLNILHKRNIQKRVLFNQKLKKVEKKDKIITSLKKTMTRNPGNEIYNHLTIFDKLNKKKKFQLKKMNLLLFENKKEIFEFNKQISGLNKTIYILKKNFFEEKKYFNNNKNLLKNEKNEKKNINKSMIEYRPPIRTGGGFTIF